MKTVIRNEQLTLAGTQYVGREWYSIFFFLALRHRRVTGWTAASGFVRGFGVPEQTSTSNTVYAVSLHIDEHLQCFSGTHTLHLYCSFGSVLEIACQGRQ